MHVFKQVWEYICFRWKRLLFTNGCWKSVGQWGPLKGVASLRILVDPERLTNRSPWSEKMRPLNSDWSCRAGSCFAAIPIAKLCSNPVFSNFCHVHAGVHRRLRVSQWAYLRIRLWLETLLDHQMTRRYRGDDLSDPRLPEYALLKPAT